MNIIVNGNVQHLPQNPSIIGLLQELGLENKPVVIEHNKVALFPRDYETTQLSDGDSVEIITIAAGG